MWRRSCSTACCACGYWGEEGRLAYLELNGITKRYGAFLAVDDLSLHVAEGEMLCLLGPSGCGKTTTLRIIAGFETVERGGIQLGGRDVTALPPEKRNIGLVFQNYALFPHLTVTENVAFGLQMRKLPRAEIATAVDAALALVQLEGAGSRYPRQLSGGQQQRVALARALAIRPRLLLLDEPLSNLDAKLRDTMRDEIRRVQREVGITAIFVTHDQGEALAMADRMAVMDRGRIMQIDTPENVYARPADPFIAGFIGQANLHAGIVSGVGPASLTSISGGVEMQGIAGGELRLGENAVAVVKMDSVSLSRVAPKGELTSLRVRVDTRTFLGTTISYACSAGADRLTAMVPRLQQPDFRAGEEVFASWSPHDCLIIRDPAR